MTYRKAGLFPSFKVILTLILMTFAALTAAYAVRPALAIDVGEYYDSAFLHNFHAREVDAAAGGETQSWPADQQSVTLRGQREGFWIATLHVAQGQPDGVLQGLAMSANGHRLTIPRQGSRFLIGIIPPDIAAAETLTLKLEPGLREGPEPPAGLVGHVVVQPARTYRWSRGESTIHLPGLGRGAWLVTLNAVTAHPNDQLVNAQVHINGTHLVTLADRPEQRRYHMLVPASRIAQGDMDVTLHARTFADPRPLGVFVSGVAVSPVAGGVLPPLPPTSTVLYSMLIISGLSICLLLLTDHIVVPAAHFNWRWMVVVSPVLLVLMVLCWALANHRFPTTFMLPGLALLAVWSLVLLLLLRPLLRRFFADSDGEVRTTSGSAVVSLAPGRGLAPPNPSPITKTAAFVNILLLIFFVGYWLKATGMLYPYFIGIDVHWHMDRVRWILNGDLARIYGVDSPLNESTMPLAEWGHEKPVIPYSPYYHMFAATFAIFPWSLEMSANMVSVLLDSLHVVLLGILAWRGSLSRRAALLAALLFTVLPVRFLLHSWGNVPTTSGMGWAFAATVFLVVAWGRLHRPRFFVAFTLLLMAAFLFYTVAGAFMMAFLLIFTLLVYLLSLIRRRWMDDERPGTGDRRRVTADGGRGTTLLPDILHSPFSTLHSLRPMWLAILLAVVLVTVIYYGQYIGPILVRTIPYFGRAFTSSAESMGKAGDTLSGYLLRHTRLLDYGLVMPLVLTTGWIGFAGWRIWRGRERQGEKLVLWAAVTGWMLLTFAFLPVAFKISMVDKHFFISIPFMVVASAALIDRFWERSLPLRVVTVIYFVYLASSALQLWLMRIVSVKQ